jgi:hypothetical protein
MFHGFFHCLTAGNNEKSRQTLFASVKQCSNGFSTVSAGEKTFQAAPPRYWASAARNAFSLDVCIDNSLCNVVSSWLLTLLSVSGILPHTEEATPGMILQEEPSARGRRGRGVL